MHFFHPIQQSASHIYHSALPLSPTPSTFHSRTLSEKTKITEFHGRPDTWGIVVRTITASSENLMSVVTFGNKIAAAFNHGVVGIYDSVTGALRLSLNLGHPVQAIAGSPDGSILFCAQKTPSITAWDMQTGGLIHTFVMEQDAPDIAVSSNGRYLACGLSDGSVEVLEVADQMEGTTVWTSSPATCFCWLEPEEHLAVSTGPLVRIWDIVTGTVLRHVPIQYPVHHMVYSQKIDKLAIMASSTSGRVMTLINAHNATLFPKWVHRNVTCFAFSQTTEELVCSMEADGIQLFNISTRRLERLNHPDTMTSVSCLKNGTVVANFAGSGIQLLSLDGGRDSTQPTISALTVHAFDQGRITAIFPTSRDHILLLETATMSQLLKIPVCNTGLTPADDTTILCASHKSLTAVYYFEERSRGFLQLWRFQEGVPRWTVEVDGAPKIAQISPTAVWFITLHAVGPMDRVYVWNAQNGRLHERLDYTAGPCDIGFTSDTEFFLGSDKQRKRYTVYPWGLGYHSGGLPPPSPERSQEMLYLAVDDAHEWVVRGSERVCWIPPGYIGSVQPSYCWVGSSLIMAGQDGTLRKLTFREQC